MMTLMAGTWDWISHLMAAMTALLAFVWVTMQTDCIVTARCGFAQVTCTRMTGGVL